MRHNQHNRRTRRSRKAPNPISRSYDSNGPDVKIRGTASQIAEKYVNLARDSQSSGDIITAENYLQHAEHYFRIIAMAQSHFSHPNAPQPKMTTPDEEGAPSASLINGEDKPEQPAPTRKSPRRPRARSVKGRPARNSDSNSLASAD